MALLNQPGHRVVHTTYREADPMHLSVRLASLFPQGVSLVADRRLWLLHIAVWLTPAEKHRLNI
jgi:hypothetical protein